jgi:hypothetical protein
MTVQPVVLRINFGIVVVGWTVSLEIGLSLVYKEQEVPDQI